MLDLIIKNGRIIDGTGAKAYCADLGIRNGKIEIIGEISENAECIIDASGLTVTPGFIDSHSHLDSAILNYPEASVQCEQGITTAIAGQCGSSLLARPDTPAERVEDFVKLVKELKLGINLASFVGHSNIRRAVLGFADREPTAEELEKMKYIVRECVRGGALGVTFGLIYNPGMFAKTAELIEIARVCAEEGGMLAAHIRNEGDSLIEAVEEMLSVVRASGARAVISHHKACIEKNHGKVNTTLKMIDEINREGYDVYCDVYPYTATATSLCARFIPKQFQADNKTLENLKDPKTREEIRRINGEIMNTKKIDWALVTRCEGHPEYVGKYVSEVAELMGVDDLEAAFRLIEISNNSAGSCYFTISERDIETVISHPRTMVGTDGGAVLKTAVHYHPRVRGTFPRAIRRFVRELGTLSLEELIRRITSLPAHVYNLKNKGLIKEGYDADICIFDYEKIRDNADYVNPHEHADGLNYVIVGGVVVAKDAQSVGNRPGRLILREERLS